jgi:hypothetical protein
MAFLAEKRRILTALIGGLAVALTVSGITVAAAAALVPHLAFASAAPTSAPGASPSTSPAHKANPARRAIHRAVMQAEAQALGLAPADFKASLRQGKTVHQLADQKEISQATFQTDFIKALTPLLDQDVSNGTITRPQEQKALDRYGAHIPNWDHAHHHR